ncbi:MAG: 30S ribosomal protein S20 [Actinobacteria bacterium]|nr:30S ribosomal protein S20 [Actinomycetota bacterium]
MANIKSQIKRNRQNERAQERNKATRSALKTKTRKVREAGDGETAQAALRDLTRSIDKAASKGVLHKRAAARRKSRIAKSLATPAE